MLYRVDGLSSLIKMLFNTAVKYVIHCDATTQFLLKMMTTSTFLAFIGSTVKVHFSRKKKNK